MPTPAASETAASQRGAVVVVTGPTASGKTGLAIEIALRFGGEVVNADSMQVYRYLEIGAAKPTPQERARVEPACRWCGSIPRSPW